MRQPTCFLRLAFFSVVLTCLAPKAFAHDVHRFSLGKTGDADTFIAPNGKPIWVLGVNHIGDTRAVRQPQEPDGIFQSRVNAAENLKRWGFNCAGGDNSGPIQHELPYFVTVGLTSTAHWMPQHQFHFEDVFAEAYASRIDNLVTKACKQHHNNPNLIGYFWTDTPRWDLDLTRNRRGSDWVSFIRGLPASAPGKLAYVRFLKEYFGDSIDRMNLAFRSQAKSFEELLTTDLSGLELIRPTVRKCDEAFLGAIAERVYSVASKAFRRHDPHALLLGEKYKSHDQPDPVLKVAAKYCDVISIQDGPEFGPFPGQGSHEATFDQAYFDGLHQQIGKPILIVDHAMSWSTPGRPKTLWYQCPTQAEATHLYDAYLKAAAGRPYMLGYCRCQYVSVYREDRGLLKQGLLDEHGHPYAEIVASFAETNRHVLTMRQKLGSARRHTKLKTGRAIPTFESLMRCINLEVGETKRVLLSDQHRISVELVSVDLKRDSIRGAVRDGHAELKIDGSSIRIGLGLYRMPTLIGRVKVHAPLVVDDQGLRVCLWPASSPLARPGTIVYPVDNEWMRSVAQSSGEVVFAKSEKISRKKPYYHYATDIGGAKDTTQVFSAVDGLVVSSCGDVLAGYEEMLDGIQSRDDQIFILDGRGWLMKYAHMSNEIVKVGEIVAKGQSIGTLSTTGTSGGWAHVHFEILTPKDDGSWSTTDAFPFLTEAYFAEHPDAVIAIAHPHHLIAVGERVELDGTKSLSADNTELKLKWQMNNEDWLINPQKSVHYDRPGRYSEILMVETADGRKDYDFALVEVQDPIRLRQLPGLHVEAEPAIGASAGTKVTFYHRMFPGDDRQIGGGIEIDFGDGSDRRLVKSSVNVQYASTEHVYRKPGDYVATCRLQGVDDSVTQHVHLRISDAVAGQGISAGSKSRR